MSVCIQYILWFLWLTVTTTMYKPPKIKDHNHYIYSKVAHALAFCFISNFVHWQLTILQLILCCLVISASKYENDLILSPDIILTIIQHHSFRTVSKSYATFHNYTFLFLSLKNLFPGSDAFSTHLQFFQILFVFCHIMPY